MPPRNFDERDAQDLATLNYLVNVLGGLQNAGLLSDLPLDQLTPWLRRRVVHFCSARYADLVDDDAPIEIR